MAYHYPVLPEGNPCDAWWTGMVTTFRRTALSEGYCRSMSLHSGMCHIRTTILPRV